MSSIKIISINTISANVPPSAAASGSSMKNTSVCTYITITRCTGMWPHSYCMHTTLYYISIYVCESCDRKVHECNPIIYVRTSYTAYQKKIKCMMIFLYVLCT